jgi:putative endonuclease
MKSYFVYILASKKKGTLYIGVTSNLEKRVWEHKKKTIEGFTKKYNVTKLVYYE